MPGNEARGDPYSNQRPAKDCRQGPTLGRLGYTSSQSLPVTGPRAHSRAHHEGGSGRVGQEAEIEKSPEAPAQLSPRPCFRLKQPPDEMISEVVTTLRSAALEVCSDVSTHRDSPMGPRR